MICLESRDVLKSERLVVAVWLLWNEKAARFVGYGGHRDGPVSCELGWCEGMVYRVGEVEVSNRG